MARFITFFITVLITLVVVLRAISSKNGLFALLLEQIATSVIFTLLVTRVLIIIRVHFNVLFALELIFPLFGNSFGELLVNWQFDVSILLNQQDCKVEVLS
jgi:hypothetical protein